MRTRELASTLTMACLLGGSADAASGPAPAEGDISATVERFQREHRGSRGGQQLESVVDSISAELPEFADGDQQSPRWRAVREASRRLLSTSPTPAKARKPKRLSGGSRPSARAFPEPTALRYRFGLRDIESLDDADRDLEKAIARGRGLAVDELPVAGRLTAMLHGCLPETELAVAAIQMDLDVHESFDEYGQFLERWTNGDEPFYEALDRTAGTDEVIFFYDAMLDDFVATFAGKRGRSWTLQERHDRLHAAFLSYRQYRGFVEAVAFAAVLPSSVAFPARLHRYDYGGVAEGAYSLRHLVDLFAAARGGDYGAVVEDCRRFLVDETPPASLWDDYRVANSFNAYFQRELPRIIVEVGSTDQTWARMRDESRRDAERLALLCRSTLAPE